MKRELYSNSLKELDTTPNIKGKSSIYFKVIVPRKTRTAQGNVEQTHNTWRNKSISSTSKRKFTLEGETQSKDSLLTKTFKESKTKIEYNPVNSSKPVPNIENPFSPGRRIAVQKEKNSSQKHGRLSVFSKSKSNIIKLANKRTGNTTRKQLRSPQVQDKNIGESDNEETNIGYNKHLLNSAYDEIKQSRANASKYSQRENKKLINKSNYTK